MATAVYTAIDTSTSTSSRRRCSCAAAASCSSCMCRACAAAAAPVTAACGDGVLLAAFRLRVGDSTALPLPLRPPAGAAALRRAPDSGVGPAWPPPPGAGASPAAIRCAACRCLLAPGVAASQLLTSDTGNQYCGRAGVGRGSSQRAGVGVRFLHCRLQGLASCCARARRAGDARQTVHPLSRPSPGRQQPTQHS